MISNQELLYKTIKVINSCNTSAQLNCAKVFMQLAIPKIEKDPFKRLLLLSEFLSSISAKSIDLIKRKYVK